MVETVLGANAVGGEKSVVGLLTRLFSYSALVCLGIADALAHAPASRSSFRPRAHAAAAGDPVDDLRPVCATWLHGIRAFVRLMSFLTHLDAADEIAGSLTRCAYQVAQ